MNGHLIIGEESHVARMCDCQNLPVSEQGRPWLEKPGNSRFVSATASKKSFSWVTPREDIKLKVADIVVAREVDRRLERHRLQTGGYCVHLRVLKITWACHRIFCQQHLSWALQDPRKDHLVECESEHLPRNDGPLPKGGSPEIGGITARVVGW